MEVQMEDNDRLASRWLLVAGVALVAAGLLGFVPGNPIASEKGLFAVDNVHNIVHIITGLLALGIAYGMRGNVANGAIGFGIMYAAVFVLTLVSPTLFGIFSVPVNALDHVLHLALAVVSIGVGWMARDTRSAATVR
jgi:uncharacterized protein DUF4383